MDPFDYDIDPVNPGLLQPRGGMSLPVTTGPSQVSSLSGGGGNMWAQLGAAALGGLSNYFSGRRESRERERDRKLQQDQLRLQRERFGLEQRQYGDEMRRRRAQSDFMSGFRDQFADPSQVMGMGRFDPSEYAVDPERAAALRAQRGTELEDLFASRRRRGDQA
jgi:hypothetical protein